MLNAILDPAGTPTTQTCPGMVPSTSSTATRHALLLFCEALYHGLLDRVRATGIRKLDINRIRLVASMLPGRAPVDRPAPAVRAALDGRCCSMHGPVLPGRVPVDRRAVRAALDGGCAAVRVMHDHEATFEAGVQLDAEHRPVRLAHVAFICYAISDGEIKPSSAFAG
jgi:hypothetical protein